MMFNPKKDIVFSWRYDLFISKDQTSTQQKPHFHSGVSGKASMSEENCYLYTLYGPLRLWTPNLRSLTCGLPSGKHTENYGKSPFVMGKSTISMAMFHSKRGYIQSLDQLIIYSKLLVITRGYINHIHRLSINYPYIITRGYIIYIPTLKGSCLDGQSYQPWTKNVEGYSTSNGSEQKEKHSGSLKNNNLAAHKKISIICIYIYYEHVYYEQHILVWGHPYTSMRIIYIRYIGAVISQGWPKIKNMTFLSWCFP